jgi:hypothetical protein
MLLHFTGQVRRGAVHLLDQTGLGDTITLLGGDVTDNGQLLTVEVQHGDEARLSHGEQVLLRFLASMAGRGQADLYDVLAYLDDDAQRAAVWGLGVACGHFVPPTPGGLPAGAAS